MEPQLVEFEQALLALDRLGAKRIIQAALDPSQVHQVVESLVVPALEHLGEQWETGQLALSQIYMSGRICEELVDQLLPPASPNRKNQPKTAIAVLEDYHLLGKRIVYSTLRANGFELRDYGQQDVNGLAAQVQRDHIEILLISTLMLPSALRVKRVREELAAYPVKIVVGGAPFRFDSKLWKEVGADATSATASGIVPLLKTLTEGRSCTPNP
jgi:methanogenic corrinoid protein MtbC1